MVKYIVVTGGVLSGIGKGIVASSTGVILKSMGLRVTSIKIDPYINIDAGTMSPFEHGEVFVLDDGGEVDLDLGNYERFLDVTLARDNNITTGKIYNTVIERERKGEYLGKTVQVVPHICNAIQEWIERVATQPVGDDPGEPDVCVIELGGTVGDIESMPFVEALRQFQFKKNVGPNNFCSFHVSLVPVVGAVGEQKTKPTQQSVRELRALGISPDVIICRSTEPLIAETKQKISLFCHVAPENVISVHDVSNTYKVPLLLEEQHLSRLVVKKLQLDTTTRADLVASGALLREPVFGQWRDMANTFDLISANSVAAVHIALVGKYTGLSDAYLSVVRSLQHAALHAKRRLIIDWIVASDLEKDAPAEAHKEAWEKLKAANGILVPGGFGDRGIEGKIAAAHFARTNKIPYLGICLGLQIAVIEYARNVLKWEDANSEEFDAAKSSKHHVVVFMPEIDKTHMGGTMRLGSRRSIVKHKDSWATKLYGGATEINERHRHRYEVNPELVPQLEAAGLRFVAQDETGKRMEILELDKKDHPFFFATQYHPEFKSRPLRASPPFIGLLMGASGQLQAL